MELRRHEVLAVWTLTTRWSQICSAGSESLSRTSQLGSHHVTRLQEVRSLACAGFTLSQDSNLQPSPTTTTRTNHFSGSPLLRSFFHTFRSSSTCCREPDVGGAYEGSPLTNAGTNEVCRRPRRRLRAPWKGQTNVDGDQTLLIWPPPEEGAACTFSPGANSFGPLFFLSRSGCFLS